MTPRNTPPTHSSLLAVSLAMLASACSGDTAPPMPISLTLTDGTQGVFAPSDVLGVGANIVDVTLTHADGSAMPDMTLVVDAFMPAHGHGLRQPPEVHDMGGGHYMIHIDFHMTGHWDMSVGLGDGDGDGAPAFSVPLEVQ